MDNQTKINNLDQYLEKLFGRQRTDKKPSSSFITFLENNLKYEFEKLYKKEKRFTSSIVSRLFPYPVWAVAFAFVLLVLTGSAITLKNKETKKMQLAQNEPTITKPAATEVDNKKIISPSASTKPTALYDKSQIAFLSESEQTLSQTDTDITNLEEKLADMELLMSDLDREESLDSENL
jgi:hypothetical protein